MSIYYVLSFFILSLIIIWERYINIPKYPKNFLYLTQINLYLSSLYYFFEIFLIFSPEKKKLESQNLIKKKKKAKNKYSENECKYEYLEKFLNFIFTISTVVTVMFWSLCLYDKKTLYKKGAYVPFLLEVSLHGGVFAINLFTVIFKAKKDKRNHSSSPVYIEKSKYLIFTILYTVLLRVLHLLWGIRVYPFSSSSFLVLIVVNFIGFLVSLFAHYLYVGLRKLLEHK